MENVLNAIPPLQMTKAKIEHVRRDSEGNVVEIHIRETVSRETVAKEFPELLPLLKPHG